MVVVSVNGEGDWAHNVTTDPNWWKAVTTGVVNKLFLLVQTVAFCSSMNNHPVYNASSTQDTLPNNFVTFICPVLLDLHYSVL